MNIEQVANRLVELCRQSKFEEAVSELYGENIVSHEPQGSQRLVTTGKADVSEKTKRFMSSLLELTDVRISDPMIAENFFSITMKMNCRMEGMPAAVPMDEVCVYHVLDGKIVNEYFFHTVPAEA